MHSGNLILILHTHLPWVLHHGYRPHGADWLAEATAECYIPLLNVFGDLVDDGILPKVTIDISPVLCEQLEHPDFKIYFQKYCDEKILAAQNDERNFTKWGYDAHHIYLTRYWQNWYHQRKNDFTGRYKSSIVTGLKTLQDAGAIEIMTCGATHGYLPLLGDDRSVNLQVQAAEMNYKKHFSRQPRGMWLPECAYRPSYNWKSLLPIYPFHLPHLRPGIEQYLSRYGLEYFVTDQKLLENAGAIGYFIDDDKSRLVHVSSADYNQEMSGFDRNPLNIFNVSSSERTEFGTVAVLTRHRDIAMQVWSGEVGYPGEADYLDFHKKLLDSMLRYWRVTDSKADMMYKSLYHPEWIHKKIDLQSNHFIHHVENTLNHFNRTTGKFGTLCTPFDTELFGHWWFEGPEFIRAVIKGLNHSPYVKTATASEQLFRMKPREVIFLPEGSWGVNNNHDVWINEDNKWTWEAIYNDEVRFSKLIERFDINNLNHIQTRVLKQALRELMLLQSSDWQFLIYTKSARDYAEQRFSCHHSDFNKLCEFAEKLKKTDNLTEEELKHLEDCEKRNSIFPELKIEWWRY